MKCRLAVITEIIAPYRVPVFNALAREAGVDLHVIFLSETDPGLRNWRIYANEIQFPYEVLPSWRRRVGSRSVLLNRGLAPALNEISPDVVICGGYNYLASWQALTWTRRKRVPFLLWIESTLMDQRGGRQTVEFLKKKFLEGCDGFIVPGKSSLEYVRSFGIPDNLVFTAPNAVANQIFQDQARKAITHTCFESQSRGLPSRYALFVGRLVREKGIFELLEAYENLDSKLKSELGLVIVGDGPARKQIERRISDGLHHSIKVAGFVHRDELAAYYALAEMLVFPTHTDTWGLVVNEAMACGLPVIASRAAGCVSDLVREGWNGFVIEPRNITQLTEAISRLSCNTELRLRMGKRSSELISEYSPEKCAAGMATAAASYSRGEPSRALQLD